MNSQFIRYITALFLLCVCPSVAQEEAPSLANRQDSISAIMSLQTQAREAMIRQDLGSVLSDLDKANAMAKALGEVELEASTSNDIAKFYYNVRNLDKAGERVESAIELLKDNKESTELAEAYLLQGQIFIMKTNYDEAATSLDKAFEIYEEKQDDSAMARIQLNKGMLALQRRNPTGAVNYLEASLTTFQELGLDYYTAQAELNKAMALMALPNSQNPEILSQVDNSVNRAVDISSQNNYTEILTESFLVRSKLEVAKNNYASAYSFLETYHQKKDSLNVLSHELLDSEVELRLERGDRV